MLNLILNLVVLFIALLIQVCKWLFAAGKYVVVHILPVLWYWFVRIIPWAGIPIALLALWQLRERFLGRVVVYLGLGGIWWLTLEEPPWRYLLAGILLWECYCLIAAIVMGLRGHSFRTRLSQTGILSPSEAKEIPEQVLAWMERRKIAVADRSGNLCSTKLLDTVCRQLNVNGAMTQPELFTASQKVVPSFPEGRSQTLLKFLVLHSGAVLLPGSPLYCIGPDAVKECKSLLYLEGAATQREFSTLCAHFPLLANLSIPHARLSSAILKSMCARGEVQKVPLSETGETLYVVNNPPSQTKMTRMEISLDD
mgnify:CR=1 FL=1